MQAETTVCAQGHRGSKAAQTPRLASSPEKLEEARRGSSPELCWEHSPPGTLISVQWN